MIANYQELIPRLMTEQGIPGLAVALVDADQTLWVGGFGHVDGPDSAPVTADTMFSVQSTSKLFTATAVMQAVGAGRLDLDEPITTYLSDFTVRSAFEDHPEEKITLRMLLSHTSGLTFDAPVGNNNDLDSLDFDTHVASISDTWLRFPVGTGYAYSNQGIDLAGYILQRVEGKPFPDVARDTLFEPLGMHRTTFDRTAIMVADDRAIGHHPPFPDPPVNVPMTAAGGMYTSAADLARFLRFQLNDGSLDGRVVLDPTSMNEMRTVPPPWEGAPAGYALGVTRRLWNSWSQRPDLFDHGGGGFGFQTDLWWAPQVGLGIGLLTNSEDHQLTFDLVIPILTDLVNQPGAYRDRLLELPTRPQVANPELRFTPPEDMASLVTAAAMAHTGDEAARWAAHAGSFGSAKWGAIDPTEPAARFLVDDGVPYWEVNEDEGPMTFRLVEVEPDVFLADNGETLDLAGPTPRWRGLPVVPLTSGPAAWQWGVLIVAAIAAATWLIAAVLRRRRSSSDQNRIAEGPAVRPWLLVAAAVAGATALLTLANVALVAVMPGLIDSGFVGWLELPTPLRLAMHLPLALAVVAGGMGLITAIGGAGRWWVRPTRLHHTALVMAAAALVVLLASWDLIGWGL